KDLEKQGVVFETETDTEVIPHLITHYLEHGKTPEEAVAATLARLEGAFALGILFADYPDLMMAARRGSPLAVGFGRSGMYLGSDALALAPFTRTIAYLEDGDIAVITPSRIRIMDEQGKEIKRDKVRI